MRYYDQLIKATLDENFNSASDILSLIIDEEDSLEYVAKLLVFMENNPAIDYGSPGPIVHYLEKYYNNGYEELLLNSIERKPTTHTLWMLNRVLNSPTLSEKEKYLEALRNAAKSNDIPTVVKNQANFYLQYQERSSD